MLRPQKQQSSFFGPGVPRSTEGSVDISVEAIYLLFQAAPIALKGVASQAESLTVGVSGHSGTSRLACKQSLVPPTQVIDLLDVLAQVVLEASKSALHFVGHVPKKREPTLRSLLDKLYMAW